MMTGLDEAQLVDTSLNVSIGNAKALHPSARPKFEQRRVKSCSVPSHQALDEVIPTFEADSRRDVGLVWHSRRPNKLVESSACTDSGARERIVTKGMSLASTAHRS